MAPLFLPLLFLLLLIPSSSSSAPLSYAQLSLLIDCGGSDNFTDAFGRQWLSDRFFSGGSPAEVSQPHVFQFPQERTLRFFPPTSTGAKSCYSIPLPPGRFYLRLFTVYDNYDSKLHPPSFSSSLGPTPLFSWPSPWPPSAALSGAYSDLLAFIPPSSHSADLCFHGIATDAPVVGSIEIISVDPLSYDSSTTGHNVILVNYGRLTCGSALFGPGFTNDTDRFGRVWRSDAGFRSLSRGAAVRALSTRRKILGADLSPNHFPEVLYRTAITSTSHDATIAYALPVDARLDYMMWFHFAEIDEAVVRAGQRVFDVFIEGVNVRRIDIFKEVGSFAAFKWQHVVRNLSGTVLNVKLVPIIGPPLISGLENYAMVPVDIATVPSQASAMRALKESLRVPERMGWNGDPCAPATWDAWEGVTCQRSESGRGLVITQLDLGSQGLKGYITDKINLLSNLISINMSSNSLEGSLPSGLGQKPLQTLDLSGNQFSGSIPDSLGASNLQLVLLNDNQLEGQVPEALYSIGVRGGEIDLSRNKGLCGVPSLPPCSFFWEKGRINAKGKLAVGLSCALLLCVISVAVYVFCKRRRRHHYEFAFSQDLASVAAKRNRYQRQKSLMLMEMETQSPNGYHSTLHPL